MLNALYVLLNCITKLCDLNTINIITKSSEAKSSKLQAEVMIIKIIFQLTFDMSFSSGISNILESPHYLNSNYLFLVLVMGIGY